MSTFTRSILHEFHIVSCYTCGVDFGIEDGLYRRAVQDKKGCVYCPSCGEGTVWDGATEQQKRIDQLTREVAHLDRINERQKARAQRAEASLRATKAVVTRTKNRISKGVCPCCNRHFDNLANHMKSKHPDYSDKVKTEWCTKYSKS